MNDLAYYAFLEATDLHRKMVRKGTEVPYLIHVLGVAEQLALWGMRRRDESDMWAAVMLHDTIEDCGNTFENIGSKYNWTIASWVQMLSFRSRRDDETPQDYQTAKSKHLDGYADVPVEVLVIKLADRYRNTVDFVNSGDRKYALKYLKRAQGLVEMISKRDTEIIERFGIDTYDKIVESFQKLEKELQ